MVTELFDAVPSSGGPSATSILNKIPTKRIDAKITAAAEEGIPEQGEQSGGYAPGYAHLSHLPLLPLYSEKQVGILEKHYERKMRKVQQMNANDVDRNITKGDKAMLNVVGHVSGASGMVSMKRWERRLQGASVVSGNMVVAQDKRIVFTRWTLQAAQGTPWFVDVVEHRYLNPGTSFITKGNGVLLKVGLHPGRHNGKVTLRLIEKVAKGLSTQKIWSKNWNTKICDAIMLVEDGVERPMDIVARIERPISSLESYEVIKRFKSGWVVPVLQ
ncbi:hypothetical protein BT63DRAFT_420992 [Microthyrium microscopicum]|uniref:Uncharacterized protein n=1 Tax=Microthyrium microscopicum TaxID=703497 RepID=A0A6A6UMU6_9PEZI|nr:hypothetical protein BT63DRAFT_420992 [Microthyrium microscopicum]